MSAVHKSTPSYQCSAILKQYPSERATWYVVTLNVKTGTAIYNEHRKRHGGFGSLPVVVTLGKTVWETSIFRDNSAKSYILFIKGSVRKQELLSVGDRLTFSLQLCG